MLLELAASLKLCSTFVAFVLLRLPVMPVPVAAPATFARKGESAILTNNILDLVVNCFYVGLEIGKFSRLIVTLFALNRCHM